MSYNSITIVGNVGGDVELRYIASGAPVANFSVAVNYRRSGGSQSGDDAASDETQWFRVVCWNKLAETVNEYVSKGTRILVEGRFRGRSYTAQDGTERHVNEIIAGRVLFLSRPGESSGAASGEVAQQPQNFPSDSDTIEDIPF